MTITCKKNIKNIFKKNVRNVDFNITETFINSVTSWKHFWCPYCVRVGPLTCTNSCCYLGMNLVCRLVVEKSPQLPEGERGRWTLWVLLRFPRTGTSFSSAKVPEAALSSGAPEMCWQDGRLRKWKFNSNKSQLCLGRRRLSVWGRGWKMGILGVTNVTKLTENLIVWKFVRFLGVQQFPVSCSPKQEVPFKFNEETQRPEIVNFSRA